MTPQQARFLDAFRGHVETFGTEPSFRELRDALGYKSMSTLQAMVDVLVAQGVLERTAGYARCYRLAGVPDLRTVPLDAIRAELARRGVTIGALDRRETRTMSSRQAHCAADGCDIDVPRGHLMCRTHWSLLPRQLQTDLFRAHARRDTAMFSQLLVEARDICAAVRS